MQKQQQKHKTTTMRIVINIKIYSQKIFLFSVKSGQTYFPNLSSPMTDFFLILFLKNFQFIKLNFTIN